MDNGLDAPPKQRKANKIGVVAAVFAAAALITEIVNLFFGAGAFRQVVGFILGCVVMTGSVIGFAAAFFADKRYRLTLIAITTSVVFAHFVMAFANFGN